MDDARGMEGRETFAEPESACVISSEFAPARATHSLMDVLMPANPPQPKNARVIRLFDLEAAKNDPRPVGASGAAAVPAPVSVPVQREPRGRNAARDERRGSLLAAAGLF